jgi:hypothetical protein
MTDLVYVLAKDITKDCRNIPKGTRLSDLSELPGGGYMAIAHIWGERIKLALVQADFIATTPDATDG